MVAKSPDAFRTISEVAEELDLPQHVLRFWETRFTQIKPLKRGGGRRYYRPEDIDLLRGIRFYLYGEGYTIRGVQRILKEQGPRFVSAAGRGEISGPRGQRPPDDDRHFDGDDEASGAAVAPRPARREPAFAEAPRPPARAEPEFDVDREDHDPDDDLRDHDARLELDPDEDDDDIGDDARRLAARFAPRPPEPAPPPRRAPPPPPRAEPAPRRSEPPRSEPMPRPEPVYQAPLGGLAEDDAERLRAVLSELLELKRILDQARSTER